MKLVVFGLGVSSAWGNGHATLWRGLLRALSERGHTCVFYERDVPYYAKTRDLFGGDGWDLALYPSWEEVAPRAGRDVADADVTIVTSYCPDAQAATDLILGAGRGKRVFYDLDTPVTLEALARGESVAYLPSQGLSAFDLVLSYTGGAALTALEEKLGAKKTAPLYGSVDLHAHHPASPSPAYACDLSYLGTYAADRQAGVEALFLEVALELRSQAFLLGGPMYPNDMARAANVRWLPHVAPAEHPAFYGSSRLTLNVTRGAMAKLGWCPSARLFEAAACGVPLVSDAWEGIDHFFDPGREIVIAKATEDVVRALSQPAPALRAMALRARARTHAQHTAKRRADELVALLA